MSKFIYYNSDNLIFTDAIDEPIITDSELIRICEAESHMVSNILYDLSLHGESGAEKAAWRFTEEGVLSKPDATLFCRNYDKVCFSRVAKALEIFRPYLTTKQMLSLLMKRGLIGEAQFVRHLDIVHQAIEAIHLAEARTGRNIIDNIDLRIICDCIRRGIPTQDVLRGL